MENEKEKIVNLYQQQVIIDEKEKNKEIRKQIRLYQEQYKKEYGSKKREKLLINRFSTKLKITL